MMLTRSFSSNLPGRSKSLRCSAANDRDGYFVSTCAEAEPRILFKRSSQYNTVRVIEVPNHPLVETCIAELKGARILVLDDASNIHSIWRPDIPADEFFTKSYWDLLTTLPSLVQPGGTIAILGLAGGSIARMINAHYPQQNMAGYELDSVVVLASRLHMGLAEIEASWQELLGVLTMNPTR